jgi:hypothetical protein
MITSGRDAFININKLVGSNGAINVALQVLPFTLFNIVGVYLTSRANATFCKMGLNYCRHGGFPCQGNTSHGIQDVPIYYVSCGNIPVYFLQRRMYYKLISHHI